MRALNPGRSLVFHAVKAFAREDAGSMEFNSA